MRGACRMRRSSDKRRFFDELAAEFSEDFSAEDLAKLRWMSGRWGLQEGMWVLEPGCGAGQVTALLVRMVGAGGEVVALDISPRMLDAARQRVGSLGQRGPGSVSFLCCRLEDYVPEAASFDAVIAYRFLPHLDDIPAGLKVVARALKPGGSLFIDHSAGREQVNRFHEHTGGAVAQDAIPEEAALRRMLDEAGLELVELTDRDDLYHAAARKATA